MSCNCGPFTSEPSCPSHGYWPKKVEELQAQNKALVEALTSVANTQGIENTDVDFGKINKVRSFLPGEVLEWEREREAVIRAAKRWKVQRYTQIDALVRAVEALEALESKK